MNKKFLYPEFQRPRVSYREVGNCQVEEKEEGKMLLEKGFSPGKVRGTERTREDSVSTGRQLHPPSFLVHTEGIITEPTAWGYLLWRLNDLLHVSHILRASLVAQMVKQCRRPGFDPWVGKILWRRAWQSTPVFMPGESHGQKSLVGYSPRGCKESDTTKQLTLSLRYFTTYFIHKIVPETCPVRNEWQFSKCFHKVQSKGTRIYLFICLFKV